MSQGKAMFIGRRNSCFEHKDASWLPYASSVHWYLSMCWSFARDLNDFRKQVPSFDLAVWYWHTNLWCLEDAPAQFSAIPCWLISQQNIWGPWWGCLQKQSEAWPFTPTSWKCMKERCFSDAFSKQRITYLPAMNCPEKIVPQIAQHID